MDRKQEYHLASIPGGDVIMPAIVPDPDPAYYQWGLPLQPVLQLQDGTYVGTDVYGSSYLTRFDASGNVLNVQTGAYSPRMATADGGLVASLQPGSAATFDASLNTTGLTALTTQSWLGNNYVEASVNQVFAMPGEHPSSYAATVGGNPGTPGTYIRPTTQGVRDEIASVARGYAGSLQWPDYIDSSGNHHNQCNLFVHDVLQQSGGAFAAPMQESWKERLKYYFGWRNTKSPIYPALAGDWANPGTDLYCWKVVPGGADSALPGDVIAQAINYSDATGHVGIVTGPQETASADSAAPCFPPYAQAGIIDLSDFGFRPDNWLDPFKDRSTGYPCRSSGQKSKAVVKRYVCQ